ncbi:MAG: zinc ribbon domain-containing protein [bacterium]|nr:zinc ribbon domain-containing protein [bacterium]
MSQPPEADRKTCSQCGSSNKIGAKNCNQCGTPFSYLRENGVLRKRCTTCGYFNRDSAKVCSQCGTEYRRVVVASRPVARSTAPAQPPSGKAPNTTQRQLCPQCGSSQRMEARVCTQCGHRFTAAERKPFTGDPISKRVQTSAPPPGAPRPVYDVSGEPAPYVTAEQLERLRREGRSETFIAQVLKTLKRP